MPHVEPSPIAGRKVTIVKGRLAGLELLVEDWWDRIAGRSWMNCDGNPVCIEYAIAEPGVPIDDEVLYGKVGFFGKLVHVSCIEGPAEVGTETSQ